MNANAIRETWAQLEAAGRVLRSLSPGERALLLDRLLAELADAHSPVRRELEAGLSGAFHPATLRAGLDLAFGAWQKSGMRALQRAQLAPVGPDAAGFNSTALIAGGALPMPAIEKTLAALLLGSTVMVRPGSRDPHTPRLLKRALETLAPALGSALAVVEFPHEDSDALAALLQAECIVAFGGDHAIRRIAAAAGEGARRVFYGHRFSVALVGAGREREAAPRLALDCALWDQLGCLSPLAVWALGDAGLLADALAEALAELGKRLPRGEMDSAEAASWRAARDEAEMRDANNSARLLGGEAFAVVQERDARLRASPGLRFLRVHPAADPGEVLTALRPHAPWLSTIGHEGPWLGPELPGPFRAFARGAVLGSMQAPPLTWRHDGLDILTPLLRTPVL